MHIQDREIRRIVDDEKEYRYGRFIDIRSQLERMTISLDENNGCYRVNARIAQENERFIVSIKISHNGDIIQATCSCGMHEHCRHIAAILFYLRKLDVQSFPYFYEMNNEASKAKKLEEIERKSKDLLRFYESPC